MEEGWDGTKDEGTKDEGAEEGRGMLLLNELNHIITVPVTRNETARREAA